MIKFKTIEFKNFLSIGNSPVIVQLDRSPTTVIVGGNGNGKSAIIDAINFTLYGKPYRKINKPDLINSINQKGLEAVIQFESKGKQYKIIRGIKPNKFEIYENSTLINQSSDNRDYQEYLETNVLGMNENAFRQIVLIGSANYVPFMQLDTSKRREVIEDLLDIKIFSNMNMILKGKLSSMKEDLKDLESRYSTSQEKLIFFEEQLAKHEADSKTSIDNLNDKLKAVIDSLNETNQKIDSLTAEITEETSKVTDAYSAELARVQKLYYALDSKIEDEEAKIKFFINNDNCVSCSQSIDAQHKAHIIENSNNNLAKYTNASSKLEAQIKHFSNLDDTNTKIVNHIRDLKADVSNLLLIKSGLETIKKSTEEELQKTNSSSNDIQNNINKYRAEVASIKTIYEDKDKIKQRYDIVQKLLKDDGIKAKIIEQYIPQINFHVNEYLDKLGLPIQFTLDENFNEVIQSRYRDKFKYYNFSEGEKSRIDNALLLTWREIAKAKNTTSTNLLFLDEVFDSSLDANATEEMLYILNSFSNTNIFIISHKADITSKVRSVIEIEKHGNFTRIKPKAAEA